MKNKIILLAIAGLIILAFAYNLPENQEIEIKIEENTPETIKIGETTLNIEVADTGAERERGLSGRESLAENEGVLFVFEREGYYGFWMKDMNFPIDIAWLDKDKKIIFIEKNVSPSTYPNAFNPPAPSLYVLETRAGFFEKNKIEIGYIAEF